MSNRHDDTFGRLCTLSIKHAHISQRFHVQGTLCYGYSPKVHNLLKVTSHVYFDTAQLHQGNGAATSFKWTVQLSHSQHSTSAHINLCAHLYQFNYRMWIGNKHSHNILCRLSTCTQKQLFSPNMKWIYTIFCSVLL